MPDKEIMYCVHGMKRDHVVSGYGSTCAGPFQWRMSKEEAASLSAYYVEYEKFYSRGN